MNRRHFLSSMLFCSAIPGSRLHSQQLTQVDPVGSFAPFIQENAFPSKVVIESMNLFRRDGNWFVRVRSRDGAEGWAVSHPSVMRQCYPVFLNTIAPYFIGKDARQLDSLVDGVFLGRDGGSPYKMQGQLFWVALASAEFAVLDMLGKIAKQPAAALLGGFQRRQINLYIANNHRSLGPEESLRRIVASVDRIDAKAVKVKIGGRMKSIDQVPGRTRALIPLVAQALGDRCTLYADANSSYLNVSHAIEVGKILENHGFAFYEEPCPFDYLEETNRVAAALKIPIAWGEQESSQWRFHWMIQQRKVRVIQPDLFYYGGLTRSLRVARMAELQGLDCTPHISGGGLGFLYMGIYAACCRNPGVHQEYKGLHKDFPWESTGTPIAVRNGAMTAPDGPGIGVRIDPDYLKGARAVSTI